MLMRIFFVLALLFATPTMSGQNEGPRSEDAYSMAAVSHLLNKESNVTTGWDEKTVGRLGDRVSVALLKILTEEELRNPSRIRKYLPLIRAAFQIPKLISVPEDRKPKVTLFLLSYLQIVISDRSLKKEIKQLSDYLATKRVAKPGD